MKKLLIAGISAWLMATSGAMALDQPAVWRVPTQPFKIADNIYYVGSKGLASYLLVSGDQAILIDGTLAENTPAIKANIKSLGVDLADVKIILNTHAHFDHAAGIASLKKATGAKFMALEEERSALEKGTPNGETNYGRIDFPAVKVDRVLHDGDVVELGDIKLTATLTPGHTKGCTTWSTTMKDGDKLRDIIIPCSTSVAGNILVGNRAHPSIVEDYRKSFARLKSMRADIVLPSHPEQTDLFERKASMEAGDNEAFVDAGLLKKIVDDSEVAFEKALKKKRK